MVLVIIVVVVAIIRIVMFIIVMQRWHSLTEANAFAAWLDHVQSSKQNRSKVQGSVMRLMHRSLCSAFAAWQQVAAHRAQQKTKMLGCLTRISNRVSLCLCLSCL